MCLNKVDVTYTEPNRKRGIGYKIVEGPYSGNYYSSIYRGNIYHLGIRHCAVPTGYTKCISVSSDCGAVYTAGFHLYENLEDAEKRLSYRPRTNRRIVKIKYETLYAAGIEIVGNRICKVLVTKYITLIEVIPTAEMLS